MAMSLCNGVSHLVDAKNFSKNVVYVVSVWSLESCNDIQTYTVRKCMVPGKL